ncbi:MAG: hypothetical protein LBH43_06085 [Treponema sp.]|jgi:hypothetical protein|nr:hypothetical protein [Treponema sp.]
MSRQEARAKGWNTWKENLIQYAKEHPEYSLEDFILQRAETAFCCWREARLAEKSRNFKKARGLYLKASECLEQVEKLTEHPPLANLLEKLKTEYYDFVVQRDPNYRLLLKHPLLWIKEHSGILQTELYKLFPDHNRDDMSYALYFAEKEGLIRREKKGRSYELFFVRDKEDEPFLTLKDDEIDIEEKAAQEAAARKGCLLVFTCVFWIGILVVVSAYTGLVGAGIVVAAFIVWTIGRKIWRKKQKQTIPPPAIPEGK